MSVLKDSKMLSVDIDTIVEATGIPRNELRQKVADVIAEENLRYVNSHCKAVVPCSSFYSKYGKRFLDVIISATGLVLLLPINFVLGVCTFFDVGRPIFFMQERIGKDGKPFCIVKFRNMTNDTDENGELLPSHQRVTKFGRFVRKTSLDELLNLWSIFKGDMAIIGPRPLTVGYKERFSKRHDARHTVRPGLECPMIKSKSIRPSWSEQFENDVYYAEHLSLGLDAMLLFSLVKMVFDRKSSKKRGESKRGTFMGYERNGDSINSYSVPIKYINLAIDRIKGNSL